MRTTTPTWTTRACQCLVTIAVVSLGASAVRAQAIGPKKQTDIQTHLEALKSDHPAKRCAAATALGNLGDKRAVEPLIEALKDSDHMVRAMAAKALGSIGDPRALDALTTAAQMDRDHFAQLQASQAVVRIHEKELAELLAPSRKGSAAGRLPGGRPSVQMPYGSGFQTTPGETARKLPDYTDPKELLLAWQRAKREGDWDAYNRLGDAMVRMGEPVVAPLLTWANKGSAAVFGVDEAARLSRMGLSGSVDEPVGEFEADVLVRIGPPAVPHLIRELEDRNSRIRPFAARVLGSLGGKRAVRPLVEALKEGRRSLQVAWDSRSETPADVILGLGRDKRLADAAKEALTEIGAPAVEPLIALLKDENKFVWQDAAHALGTIGDARAVEPLTQMLDEVDDYDAPAVIVALEHIGGAGLEPLLKALKHDRLTVRQTTASALGRMGDKRAVPALIEAIDDPVLDARFDAIGALGQIGDERAVPRLIEALEDPAFAGSAGTIMGALSELGDLRAVEPLIRRLKSGRFRGSSDPYVPPSSGFPLKLLQLNEMQAAESSPVGTDRPTNQPGRGEATEPRHCDIFQALSDLGDKRAVGPLIDFLLDQAGDPTQRTRAARTLANLGGARAVKAIIDAHAREKLSTELVAELLVQIEDAPATQRALEETGNDRLVEQVIDMLDQDDRYVPEMATFKQQLAAAALGLLGDRRAMEPLTRHAPQNAQAAKALARLKHGRAAKAPLD